MITKKGTFNKIKDALLVEMRDNPCPTNLTLKVLTSLDKFLFKSKRLKTSKTPNTLVYLNLESIRKLRINFAFQLSVV